MIHAIAFLSGVAVGVIIFIVIAAVMSNREIRIYDPSEHQ